MPGTLPRHMGNCVVGTNSVVTKSVEAGSVVADALAKLLRNLAPKSA